MTFLDRVRECQVFDPSGYTPFVLDGAEVGLVHRDMIAELGSFPDVFEARDHHLTLRRHLADPEQRTAAVDAVLRRIFSDRGLSGWRGELYPVGVTLHQRPMMLVERAAVPLFGFRAYGVHLNGYVRRGNDLLIWVGRRSSSKPTAPGKLDQIVAGGMSVGYSARATLLKECGEEASIPEDMAAQATPVGALSYRTERPEGLRRDVVFVFDLELSSEFMPLNTDGEIEEFFLWPVGKVIEVLTATQDFKFNCALVLIDFLMRFGKIEPDHPDYVEIARGLHSD